MITIEVKKIGEPGFTDKTNQIQSVQITQGVTKEATTGKMTVKYITGKYKPEGEDEIMIYDDGVAIFGGFVSRPTQKVIQGPIIIYECDLKNKVYLLNRKLVNTTYSSEKAIDIIEDIVSKFSGAGITTVNVEDDASATGSFVFNNIEVSVAIQQIADQFSKEWYVDPTGDIHFFSKFAENAPFDLDDDGGKYIWESLQITEDYTQIKNSILVEGGKEKSTATSTDKFVGNAQSSSYVLSRLYTDITVTVAGVAKTVGIQNIDTFATKDCLYDYDMGVLYFNPASPPANGALIEVTGKYYFAIAVRYKDLASIGTYGEREFRIQDKNIGSRTDAAARARAEITAYGQAVSEGSFETYESGLVAGQKIHIGSVLRGISADFIIQRLTGKMLTSQKMVWTVSIVSVKTYELIDLLSQIVKNTQPLETSVAIVTANSFTKGEKFARTITIGTPMSVERSIEVSRENLTYINNGPQWVAGPYTPTSLADRKRVAWSDRHCFLRV